jgi:2-polyprenyl-3-methyl-5-hydroxy-6-metoxy-1,4-benzoquinol methylase
MSAQYDAIADQYRQSTGSPLREFVEAYSLQQRVGDVRGKKVLDLGCGEGFFTRRFKTLGAGRVTGVDISPAMIALARDQEARESLGLDYVCADVQEMDWLGEFDIVVAAYLLHYSRTEQELQRMCDHIVKHLPAGGRFVTLNENPEQAADLYSGYEQYGFNKTVERPRHEGSEITYWMVSGRELFKFQAYFFCRETYERVLRRAGFRHVAWHPVGLDDAGIEARGAEYWREYLENPPIVALECRI